MTKEQTSKQIQLHSPDLILWHSLIRKMPRWADESPEMAALVADIRERGIDQPLIVCETDEDGESPGWYYLIDGRHRHRAAVLAGLTSVPVVVRKESDALGIVLGSITQRRHFSKGALAYLCYPVIAAAIMPHGGDRKSKLIESTLIDAEPHGGDRKSKLTESTLPDSTDLCARLGFSRDLYFQARRVHEIFAQYPEMKERFEPAILSGESGIGAVLAGIGSSLITKGQPRNETNFLSWDDGTINFGVCVPWPYGGDPCSDRWNYKVGRFQLILCHDDATGFVPSWTYVVRPAQSYRGAETGGAILRTMRDTVQPDRCPAAGKSRGIEG